MSELFQNVTDTNPSELGDLNVNRNGFMVLTKIFSNMATKSTKVGQGYSYVLYSWLIYIEVVLMSLLYFSFT